jgi:hypothetical protein
VAARFGPRVFVLVSNEKRASLGHGERGSTLLKQAVRTLVALRLESLRSFGNRGDATQHWNLPRIAVQ